MSSYAGHVLNVFQGNNNLVIENFCESFKFQSNLSINNAAYLLKEHHKWFRKRIRKNYYISRNKEFNITTVHKLHRHTFINNIPTRSIFIQLPDDSTNNTRATIMQILQIGIITTISSKLQAISKIRVLL